MMFMKKKFFKNVSQHLLLSFISSFTPIKANIRWKSKWILNKLREILEHLN